MPDLSVIQMITESRSRPSLKLFLYLQNFSPQAAERKKEIVLLKSGRTVCPKTGKRTKIDGDSSTTTLTTPKKMSEDDFIVDYHYGDSVSNDDEVAKINAKLAEKQRRKMSGDNLVKTHAAAASESSYYPSTNSEFSTPGKYC
jgi:hypothetical protein